MTTYIEINKSEYNGKEFNVPIVRFDAFKNLEWINAGFSTRLGGISDGIYSSLNLSFSQGDDASKVMANHQIFANAFGVSLDNCVYSHQTHTTNVLKITDKHAGMGFTKERAFSDIDGLITNKKGIALVTSYADCVPLFFVDPVTKAIGLSHSGWRGTVNNIAKVTIDAMTNEFGTKPSDIIAFIGPSICRECFEVSDDVASEFINRYSDTGLTTRQLADTSYIVSKKPDTDDKYLVNLHAANYENIKKAGVNPRNISVTDVCTCCNPHLFFSHRASKGKRGGLCGYLMIR